MRPAQAPNDRADASGAGAPPAGVAKAQRGPSAERSGARFQSVVWMVAAAAVVSFGSQGELRAQDEFPRTTLGRAASCYYALDYPCVVELLATLPVDYPPGDRGQIPGGLGPLDLPLLLEAGRILAVAQLALGEETQARSVFGWLLEIDPRFLVTGTEVPPRFLAVFYEVRAGKLAPPEAAAVAVNAQVLSLVAGRSQQARKTAVRVAALPPRPGTGPRLPEPLIVSVTAGGSWLALTGADTASYKSGYGFTARGRLVFEERWVVGARVGISLHPVLRENLLDPGKNELRLLTVAVDGGVHFRLAQGLALEPGVHAGLATYGVSAWAQRSGPVFGTQLAAQMSWLAPVLVTVEGGAFAVTPLQGGPRASVVLHGGLSVGATF